MFGVCVGNVDFVGKNLVRPSSLQKLISDFQRLYEFDKKFVLALIAEMKKQTLK